MNALGQKYALGGNVPRFGAVFCTIAYWLLWSEDFLHTFEAIGIDPADWPDELPRHTVEAYLEHRESNGHKFAQWNLLIASDVLREQAIEDFDISDLGLVRGSYFEALEKYRSNRLQVELARHPEKTQEIIETFKHLECKNLEAKSFADWLGEFSDEWQRTGGESFKPRRLPGFYGISEMIGGFNPGRVTMILADTGFGKTNFGINLAISAASIMPTLYVNMEMIPHDFTRRVLTARLAIASPTDLHAKLEIESGVAKNLFVSPGTDLSIPEIRGLVKRYVATRKVQFLVIDYDQKLKLTIDRGQQEWQALHRALVAVESMAKALDLQICVLAQTNEEGRISGSRRSLFPASAVLRFHNHDQFGPVIEAVKNRFGPRGAAYTVDYDARLCQVREGRPLELLTKKPIREVLRGISG